MARVVVIGPNLLDQSTGSFHVHAEGCADIKRSPAYASREFDGDKGNVIDYASPEAMVEDVYSDIIAEDPEGNSVANLLSDFHIFPCVDFEKVRVPGTTVDAYKPQAEPITVPALPAKKESAMHTVRFEIIRDGFLFEMEISTRDLDGTLSEVFAMRNSRNIRY